MFPTTVTAGDTLTVSLFSLNWVFLPVSRNICIYYIKGWRQNSINPSPACRPQDSSSVVVATVSLFLLKQMGALSNIRPHSISTQKQQLVLTHVRNPSSGHSTLRVRLFCVCVSKQRLMYMLITDRQNRLRKCWCGLFLSPCKMVSFSRYFLS